jgi:hypothetical protein
MMIRVVLHPANRHICTVTLKACFDYDLRQKTLRPKMAMPPSF